MKKTLVTLFITTICLFLLSSCSAPEQTSAGDAAIAFVINGKAFSLEQYHTYKEGSKGGEQEIFERYVRQQLMLMEAEKAGHAVTDEEIEADVAARLELMEQDSAGKQIIESYLAEKGITMEGYKESMRQISRQSLSAQKWKQQLKKKYDEDNPTDPTGDFNSYFDDYVDELREKAEIEIVDEMLKNILK